MSAEKSITKRKTDKNKISSKEHIEKNKSVDASVEPN